MSIIKSWRIISLLILLFTIFLTVFFTLRSKKQDLRGRAAVGNDSVIFTGAGITGSNGQFVTATTQGVNLKLDSPFETSAQAGSGGNPTVNPINPQYLALSKVPTGGLDGCYNIPTPPNCYPYYWTLNSDYETIAGGLDEIIRTVGSKGTNNRKLAFMSTINYLHTGNNPPLAGQFLQKLLRASFEKKLPIVIALDGWQFRMERPDLWKWWDPNISSDESKQRKDAVEWAGWDNSSAIPIAWELFAFDKPEFKMPPNPNLANKRVIDANKDQLHALVLIIANWYNNLPADQKYLLAGVKLGWEVRSFNNYYPKTGLAFESMEYDANPQLTPIPRGPSVQTGYAGVKTLHPERGTPGKDGPVTAAELDEVMQKYFEELAKVTVNLGIPRGKVITHALAPAFTSLFDTSTLKYIDGLTYNTAKGAVTQHAQPGWSIYEHSKDVQNAFGIDDALNLIGYPGYSSPWAASEWLCVGSSVTARCTRDQWVNAIENTFNYRNNRWINIYNWDGGGVKDDSEALAGIKAALGTPVTHLVDQPVLNPPVFNGRSVTLSWTPGQDNQSFTLLASSSPDINSYGVFSNLDRLNLPPTTSTSYTINAPIAGTYYWQVVADGYGQRVISETGSFTTSSPLTTKSITITRSDNYQSPQTITNPSDPLLTSFQFRPGVQPGERVNVNVTFTRNDNTTLTSSATITYIPIPTATSAPTPTRVPTPIPGNLLNTDMQNTTITFNPRLPNPNSNQKLQWFFDSNAQGTFRISGNATNGGLIQVDEYKGKDNAYVAYHLNNSTFTTQPGNKIVFILRKNTPGTATFTGVSLIRVSTPTPIPTNIQITPLPLTRDVTRRANLQTIKNALENYQKTNGKYPATNGWVHSSTGSTNWIPGLTNLPRDPINNGWFYDQSKGKPLYGYSYYTSTTHGGTPGSWYMLIATLENPTPQDLSTSCTSPNKTVFNYGKIYYKNTLMLCNSVNVPAPTKAPTPIPTSTQTPQVRDNIRRSNIQSIKTVLESYRRTYGKYPITIGNTWVHSSTGSTNWIPGLTNLPRDPINNGWFYDQSKGKPLYGYSYYTSTTHGGTPGSWYMLIATLENPTPQDLSTSCTSPNKTVFNYGKIYYKNTLMLCNSVNVPAPTKAPTPIPVNLLNTNMQNTTITFNPRLPNPNSNQKLQWFFDSNAQGTFRISGNATNGGLIGIDEYKGKDNTYVAYHLNNSTFTTQPGNKIVFILRKNTPGTATFTGVKLIRVR